MLELTEDLFINSGGMRRCYRHPQDGSRCVKVYRRPEEIPQWMKRWRIWWGQRFPSFNINIQEYAFWRQLVAHPDCSDLLKTIVPHMDGMVETNLGSGLVQELLVDDDGSAAKNLVMVMGQLSEAQWASIDRQLERLADCVIEHALPIYDWNPENFLLVRRGDDLLVKVADLEGEFGNKELIKLSRHCRPLRQRKLRRRYERFSQALRRRRRIVPPENR